MLLNFSSGVPVRSCFYKIKIIIIELAQHIQTELGPSSVIRDGKNSESLKRKGKEREG